MRIIISNRGFTLLELTIVMFILTLIICMSVPSLKKIHARRDLHTTALQLQQEIRSLGQEALIRESSSYYISFSIYDKNRDYYIIYGPDRTRKINMPPGIDIINMNFNDHLMIYMSARGQPTKGGHITLKSTLTEEFKYVIIGAVTGRTRVSDEPPL